MERTLIAAAFAASLMAPLTAMVYAKGEGSRDVLPPGSVSQAAGLEAWQRIEAVVTHPRCANCHVLHSHGAAIGPDLTPFKRDDVPHLLLHIVNPSAEIREGYENQIVITESGRTLNGVLAEKDARVVVLKTADGQKVVVPRNDVAEMTVAGQSLMPENLLQGLTEQETRDLFAYLRSSQPLNERKK